MENTEKLLNQLRTTLEEILRAAPLVSHVESVQNPVPPGRTEVDLVVMGYSAPDASPETSQFHIIQPHVVK